jgi:hypothetical protein
MAFLSLYINQSINQSKRKTSNVQNLTHLGHEHQAPDHEATQPMMVPIDGSDVCAAAKVHLAEEAAHDHRPTRKLKNRKLESV